MEIADAILSLQFDKMFIKSSIKGDIPGNLEEFDLAIAALSRLDPKTPVKHGEIDFKCPTCGRLCGWRDIRGDSEVKSFPPVCTCGQFLDWSEV